MLEGHRDILEIGNFGPNLRPLLDLEACLEAREALWDASFVLHLPSANHDFVPPRRSSGAGRAGPGGKLVPIPNSGSQPPGLSRYVVGLEAPVLFWRQVKGRNR